MTSDPWDPEEHQLEEILAHQESQDARVNRISVSLLGMLHFEEVEAEDVGTVGKAAGKTDAPSMSSLKMWTHHLCQDQVFRK